MKNCTRLSEIWKQLAFVFLLTYSTTFNIYSQIVVVDTFTDVQLAEILAGQGVTITNVTSNCADTAMGYFEAFNSNLGINTGIVLTSGFAQNVVGPNDAGGITGNNGFPGDPDLDLAISGVTNDACVLEFDLEVTSDSLTFTYVFGSDEYTEFVNTTFNDAFAFYISGPGITGSPNIALIPGTTTPVSINNVNNGNGNAGPCVNCAYYIDNGDGFTAPTNTDSTVVQYDGFTAPLIATIGGLDPCQTYHLKLVVADVSDFILDSGVFLEAQSIASQNIQILTTTSVGSGFNNAVENCDVQAFFNFTLNDTVAEDFTISYQIGGTAVNGVDYNLIIDSIVISQGDSVAVLTIDPIADFIPEGLETVVLYLVNQCNGLVFDSAVVFIQDDIEISAIGAVDTICELNAVQLYASGAAVYSWSPPLGLDNPFTANPMASPLVTTLYQVTGLLGTCSDVDSAWVYISDEFLTIDAGPDDSICLNASSPINLSVNGNYGPYDITWTPSDFLDADTIFNPVSTPEVTTTYAAEVVSSTGCTRRDSMTVFMTGIAPVVSVTADPLFLCDGDTVSLYSDVLACQCGVNSLPCSGTFGITTVGTGLTGSADPTPYKGFWHDARVQMLYTATEIGAGGLGCISITDIAFNISNKQSTVDYSNFTIKMGCTDQTSLSSFIPDLDVVMAGQTVATVAGLNTHSLDNSYIWDGVNNLVVEICFDNTQFTADDEVESSTTTFNSVVQEFTDFNIGCDLNQFPVVYSTRPNITLVYCELPPPNLNFTWSPDSNIISSNLDSALAVISTGTTFELEVIDGICDNSAAVTVSVEDNFEVVAGTDTILCPNNVVQLNAIITGSTSPGITFTWDANPELSNTNISNPIATPTAPSSLYIVHATTSSGCSDIDSIVVQMDVPFTVDAGEDAFFCDVQNVPLNAQINGQLPDDFLFLWEPQNELNNATLQSPTATPTPPSSTYIVEATSPLGCVDLDTVTISLEEPFTVDAGSEIFQCNENTVQLNATISSGNPANYTYAWSPSAELSDPNISNPIASPSLPSSTYSVTVTSAGGCIHTGSIDINIAPIFSVPFFMDSTINLGEQIVIGITTTGGSGNFLYDWQPSNALSNPGSASTAASPVSDQLYTVIVTDQGSAFCSDTSSVQVFVLNISDPLDSLLVFPNAFSPNGDGLNETFYPLMTDTADLIVNEFRIYNRWGDVIHDNSVEAWDGNYNGENQLVGPYVYYTEVRFPNNRIRKYQGTVTLLR